MPINVINFGIIHIKFIMLKHPKILPSSGFHDVVPPYLSMIIYDFTMVRNFKKMEIGGQ